jgi:hypothetical protein
MRTILRDVVRHPSWLVGWWLEWPCRHLNFWRLLLFEPGQGWLRWGKDERSSRLSYMEPPETYVVAPPLHRLVWNFRGIVDWLLNRDGLRDDAPFDWAVCRGFYRDEDRKQNLWSRP